MTEVGAVLFFFWWLCRQSFNCFSDSECWVLVFVSMNAISVWTDCSGSDAMLVLWLGFRVCLKNEFIDD